MSHAPSCAGRRACSDCPGLALRKPCHEPHTLSAQERKRAHELVSASSGRGGPIAFIGFTERYAESVCLFHILHGGPVYSFEVEKGNTPGIVKLDAHAAPRPDAFDDAVARWDDADTQLYELASARFEADLSAHRDDMKACLSALNVHGRLNP